MQRKNWDILNIASRCPALLVVGGQHQQRGEFVELLGAVVTNNGELKFAQINIISLSKNT